MKRPKLIPLFACWFLLPSIACSSMDKDSSNKAPAASSQKLKSDPKSAPVSLEPPGLPDQSEKVKRKAPKVATQSDLQKIKNVIRRYRKAKSVKMRVKKKVVMSLLDREKKSEGKIFFSKGRLRMDIKKPDESMLLLLNDVIWVVNKLPKELGGKVQVAKVNTKGPKRKNAMIAFLFDSEEIWDEFVILEKNSKGQQSRFKLKPKPKTGLTEVELLEIEIDHKKSVVRKLTYWDDLENETSYRFSKVDFKAKVPERKFRYTPPKGVDVTEY